MLAPKASENVLHMAMVKAMSKHPTITSESENGDKIMTHDDSYTLLKAQQYILLLGCSSWHIYSMTSIDIVNFPRILIAADSHRPVLVAFFTTNGSGFILILL